MTKYEWIKPYINEKFNVFYENNVVKNRLMEYDFLRELDCIYDNCIEYIYDMFENSCKNYYPSNIILKFVDYVSNVYIDIRGKYYGEKYDCNNDTSITIIYEIPSMLIAQKHICNCSRDIAKSYKRHFEKLNKNAWNDYTQTGLYCLINSRNYCTNHDDFEHDYIADYIDFEFDYNI